MGQKIPKLITAIAATAIVSVALPSRSLVHASTFHNELGELWSISEAKDIYYEVEAGINALCGNDYECRCAYDNEHMFVDSKYQVARAYSSTNMFITAINPEKNSIRVFYRDLNDIAIETGEGEIHRPLTELRIVWLDSNYNRYGTSFIEGLREDLSVDGVHLIYSASTELNGANWFPVESEVEIIAQNTHLSENTNNIIEFFAAFEPSALLSTSRYSSCIQSSEYESGMECRIMFKESGGYTYIPVRADDQLSLVNSSVSEEGNDANVIAVSSESLNTDESNVDSISHESGNDQVGKSIETTTEVLSPNTGTETTPLVNDKNTIVHNHGETDLNWHIIIVGILCGLPVIWLALPNRRKNLKNPKKVLTNKAKRDKMGTVQGCEN